MYDAVILCGTPRSGSTLLCGLLGDAGVGAPDSFFGERFMDDFAAGWGLPPERVAGWEQRYFDAALRAGRYGTPIFALRLMRENLEFMLGFLSRLFPSGGAGKALIAAAFGRVLFLHLSRREKLAQAVSRVKAEQTGLWHIAPDGSEIERTAPPQAPRYDFDRIHAEVMSLETSDAAWNDWFAAESIAPLRITYEELSEDPSSPLHRICSALGLPMPAQVRPGVARLSDATSADWIRRYRVER